MIKHFILSLSLLISIGCLAHPMPNSILLLDIKSNAVSAELQLPLSELQLAYGHDVTKNTATLIARMGPQLEEYILAHIHPLTPEGRIWTVNITGMQVQAAEQTATGPYQELTVHLLMQPPAQASSRVFNLQYDVILHQVVTHKTMVAVRQDWDSGEHGENTTEIGVIQLDIPANTIPPLAINQQSGSIWRGFKSMVSLGIEHIAEGTDHLLFLLVLLLPAPLLVKGKRWGPFGGSRYSIMRLINIATAFTIGHSVTLLAGALGWLRLPSQPVEVLIAFSILISAIHAVRPIFPGKETYIAAGFGLIHGLAFAGVLANMDLEGGRMALSILGFNLGIEMMQLFVIALTVPWLILLSRTSKYTWIRITGAIFAGIAAVAWMIERIFAKPNIIGAALQQYAKYTAWLVPCLAVLALVVFWMEQKGKRIGLLS